MTYAETIDWLVGLEVRRGWDLKLESVRAALTVLGAPERAFPSLHVAGTNGKGSTCAIAHSVLGAAGLRVGLYTSPHLVDFRERILVGNAPISEAEVVDRTAAIRGEIEARGIELTFFELATVLAFDAFARARVDVAVVEVGLGGRLDATNVIVPRASAVTSIDFDHERYLGDTLAAIAAEKAGIFKRAVPAVVGAVDGEALEVLERIAAERGAPLARLGRDFRVVARADGFDWTGVRTVGGLRCGLRGRYQIENAAVALAALEGGGWLDGISDDAIRGGVARARWPGRLETVCERPLVVLDGAHNPAGAAALAREIPAIAVGRPVHLLFGVLADKRWPSMIEALAPFVADVTVVPVAERRSEDPARVAAGFAAKVPTRVAADARAAIDDWLCDPRFADSVVVVAGSLFLVGEVRRHLFSATESNRAKSRAR